MSKTMSFPVSDNFNLEKFTAEFTEHYRAQQYNVSVIPEGERAMRIVIGKNSSGIKYFLGLGVKAEISVTLTKYLSGNNSLYFDISDGASAMRIIDIIVILFIILAPRAMFLFKFQKDVASAVGFCICLLPIVTCIKGFANNAKFMGELELYIRRSTQKQC